MDRPLPRSPWVPFSAVAVGTFMATVDGSIVNVALPTMRTELGTTIGGAEWIVTAYLLTVTFCLLLAGRLGDEAGHRRVFTGGLLVFTLGSGLCGAAPGLPSLVGARVVQALGASAMMAMGPAVVTALFPVTLRGRALGAVTSVVAVGLTAGPPLGGFLVEHLSWRWVFLVNLPIGVAGAIWAARVLPPLLPEPGHRRSPLVDLSLFSRRTFRLGILAGFLSYASLFTATLLNPFFLAERMGLGPRELGAMMMIVPLALSVASPVAGWLADRFPRSAPGAAGMLLVAGGLGGLALLPPGSSLLSFGVRQAALGLGMGLFQPPNNSAVMGALPRERLGAGGGLLAIARNGGMVLGIAAAGALFRWRAGPAPDAAAFHAGYRGALLFGAALALAAGLLSALAPGGPAPAHPAR
ncbi:MAG: MFS transporter [Deltaproteobacteria bacterium]|nr:MFS transporter [Deltaproteobacteria bacterium]